MYDKFEPFNKIELFDFAFHYKRFEVWEDGKLIDSGNLQGILSFTVENSMEGEIAIMRNSEQLLNSTISHKCEFDILMTSYDRVMFLVLPKISNMENHLGFQAILLNVNPTREIKTFERNEPFCGNLFLKDEIPEKISFNLGNPERIIEYYAY